MAIKHKNNPKTKIFTYIFFVSFLVLIIRIFSLQFIPEERLLSKAEAQHKDKKVLTPTRGSIFDANGVPLAMSVNVYTLKVVPCEISDKKQVAELLSSLLEIDKDVLFGKLSSKRKSVYVKRKLSEKEYKKIKQLNLFGVYFDKESKRFYPKAQLASHVVGFVGMDPIGLEGIERFYDKELSGIKGYYSFVKDARSCEILGLNDKMIQERDGYDVYLTIDETIQYIVEREIAKVYEKDKPVSISAVVIEPKTGYILGMASLPNYDPNNIIDSYENVRNRVITDLYEPGSTFKVVTLAAALNEKVVSPEEKIFCEKGSFRVKGRRRPLHDHKPHGWLTVEQVLQKSSNIGTVKIAIKMGKKKLYNYIRAFGFGHQTNVDLPGEISGSLTELDKWQDSAISAVPMGQGLGVTAIQLVSAMSAIANKGVLMKPKVVKELRNSEGVVVKKFEPEPLRRVVTEKVAKRLSEIMVGVVSAQGTARRAKVEGVDVAGKTGTSQKFDNQLGKYSDDKYVASFVGFLPADDPKLCVLVAVDEPPYAKRYGGVIAAPVFANIARDGLLYLKSR